MVKGLVQCWGLNLAPSALPLRDIPIPEKGLTQVPEVFIVQMRVNCSRTTRTYIIRVREQEPAPSSLEEAGH
jgi:hypothetical protein